MSTIQIIADSSSDIPNELLKKYNIDIIPFYVSFDEVNYFKEIEEISIQEFYNKLQSTNIFPKTSLPSVQDYINKFTNYIKQGKNIICICISDKFSGSYQAAVNAKNIVMDEYSNANIVIINSILATSVQGLLVLEAAKMVESEMSFDEIVHNIEKLKQTATVMFTVGTLEYLQKGGRIGKVSALAGNMLNLKPMIQLKDGELYPNGTVRGRKKSLKRVIEMTSDYFEKISEDYNDYQFCITTGTAQEEAEKVKEQFEESFGIKIDYPLFNVGVTIGTYTGPDPVGVCLIKNYNKI